MHNMKIKGVIALVVLLSVVGLAPASIPSTLAHDNNHPPDLPSPLCDSLEVPSGNRVARVRTRWACKSTDGTAPVGCLWNQWRRCSPTPTITRKSAFTTSAPPGRATVAAKWSPHVCNGCTPDPTAIPWLLLQTVTTDGSGIFSSVTYIQRVNTRGGLAPTAPGVSIGAVAEVPYTAEYYFYRARN